MALKEKCETSVADYCCIRPHLWKLILSCSICCKYLLCIFLRVLLLFEFEFFFVCFKIFLFYTKRKKHDIVDVTLSLSTLFSDDDSSESLKNNTTEFISYCWADILVCLTSVYKIRNLKKLKRTIGIAKWVDHCNEKTKVPYRT